MLKGSVSIMSIELVLPNISHKNKYEEMINEWINYSGRLHPAALNNNSADYETWLKWIEEDRRYETCPEGSPPQTLYFCMENDEIIGAVTIRDYLNAKTIIDGGYIGFGVRPSKRRMGKATEILRLAIQTVYDMGVFEILLTCAEDNIGSERMIQKNGAKYERTIKDENGISVKHFWLRRSKR